VKVAEFVFGLFSFIKIGALVPDWYWRKVVFQHTVDWFPDHCHVTMTLVEFMIESTDTTLTPVGAKR